MFCLVFLLSQPRPHFLHLLALPLSSLLSPLPSLSPCPPLPHTSMISLLFLYTCPFFRPIPAAVKLLLPSHLPRLCLHPLSLTSSLLLLPQNIFYSPSSCCFVISNLPLCDSLHCRHFSSRISLYKAWHVMWSLSRILVKSSGLLCFLGNDWKKNAGIMTFFFTLFSHLPPLTRWDLFVCDQKWAEIRFSIWFLVVKWIHHSQGFLLKLCLHNSLCITLHVFYVYIL